MRKISPALVALAFVACDNSPVADITSSYNVQLSVLKEKGNPAKLDVLWVVDDSSSMCQEQQSLARSFAKFLDVFQRYTAIDMRVAVTTTNFCAPTTALELRDKSSNLIHCKTNEDCEALKEGYVCKEVSKKGNVCVNPAYPYCKNNDDCASGRCKLLEDGKRHCLQSGSVRGEFVYNPSTQYPPACREERVVPCLTDAWCQQSLGSSDWVCKRPEQAQYLYICDKPQEVGSDPYEGDVLRTVSSVCRRTCEIQKDALNCAREFGKPSVCDEICKDGGSCDAQACVQDPTVVVDNACDSLCLDLEQCKSKCMVLLQDAGRCSEICNAEDCSTACTAVWKQPKCAQVCKSDWDCLQACEAYLYDTQKCQGVCAVRADDCFTRCTQDFFPEEHFLCALVCSGAQSCVDRCIAQFGDATYRCVYPGNDKMASGCIPRPKTQYCPKNGPKILDREVAEQYFNLFKQGKWMGDPAWWGLDDETVKKLVFELLFICMASVGTEQAPCGMQEQGLMAAWKALDVHGENAAQAKQFLRDDAYLLIVVVSDEDDCSSVSQISLIDAPQCSCMTDSEGCTAEGECGKKKGPLYPPQFFVNRLKALRPDPSQVVFASIVGMPMPNSPLSPVPDEDEIAQRYFDCKCSNSKYADLNYVCLSSQGKADLGARYIRVARGFGEGYGQVSNICSDVGLEDALNQIAQLVVPLLTQVCLPRPLAADEYVEVIEIGKDRKRQRLVQKGSGAEGEDWDYTLERNSPMCRKFDPQEGWRTENAIRFRRAMDPDTQIQILYSAAPFYKTSE